MPLPDERTTLGLPEATPVLHTRRTTHDTDGTPLLARLTISADAAELAYRITADGPRALRAVRS